jgi:hypothetical protein
MSSEMWTICRRKRMQTGAIQQQLLGRNSRRKGLAGRREDGSSVLPGDGGGEETERSRWRKTKTGAGTGMGASDGTKMVGEKMEVSGQHLLWDDYVPLLGKRARGSESGKGEHAGEEVVMGKLVGEMSSEGWR